MCLLQYRCFNVVRGRAFVAVLVITVRDAHKCFDTRERKEKEDRHFMKERR